jgi:hypothetical protein
MAEVSQRITDGIENHPAEAERVVGSFEAELAAGLIEIDEG